MNQMKLFNLASNIGLFEQYNARVVLFEKIVFFGVPALLLLLLAFICYIKVEEKDRKEKDSK